MQSLSRFYKLTLSRKKGISTIAKEEEHVSIYVHLQNMRYHDSISFISDIPLNDIQLLRRNVQHIRSGVMNFQIILRFSVRLQRLDSFESTDSVNLVYYVIALLKIREIDGRRFLFLSAKSFLLSRKNIIFRNIA